MATDPAVGMEGLLGVGGALGTLGIVAAVESPPPTDPPQKVPNREPESPQPSQAVALAYFQQRHMGWNRPDVLDLLTDPLLTYRSYTATATMAPWVSPQVGRDPGTLYVEPKWHPPYDPVRRRQPRLAYRHVRAWWKLQPRWAHALWFAWGWVVALLLWANVLVRQ